MNSNNHLSNPRGQRLLRREKAQHDYRSYSLLALAMAALVLAGSSRFPRAHAQNTRARFEQDLAQVFLNHEELTITQEMVTEQVRSEGRVSFVPAAPDFELQLEPNDLRAPNYRAEQTDSD